MFAYKFTVKLQEPFKPDNGPIRLTADSIHYSDSVPDRLILLADNLADFCSGRAINLLFPVNNLISVSG